MNYQLAGDGAISLESGNWFPFVDGNQDYEVYKLWKANGGSPLPAVPDPWRDQVWAEFRVRRDLYLSRLADIAGRYYRKGDADIPPAADAIAQGLLDMPARADLALPATRDDLEHAIVVDANQLLKAQLVNPDGTPKASALKVKAALDQVFKP